MSTRSEHSRDGATYAERYIAAVRRALPDASRDDVENELRASLADDIEARIATGADPETAERDALAAMGDPDRLAAEYAGRPLWLIGPALYLDWRRLLTVLLSIVLPIVVAAVVLAQALAGSGPIDVVLSALGTAFSVGVAMAFWVTVIFAIIERTGAGTRPLTTWQVDDLPASTVGTRQVRVGDLVGPLIGLVILLAFLVWQATLSPFATESGEPVPLIDPALWAFWVPWFIAVAVIEVIFAVVLYRRGVWNLGLAVANIVIAAASAVPMIVLIVRDQIVNPALSTVVAGTPLEELEPLIAQSAIWVAIVIGAIALGESISGVVKAARARR